MNEQINPRGATFAFRKRWGQIDWRSLAAVDVDRIARETDFQALQENIMNITFCNIESEEFRNVDVNFVKLFRLSQLIIEYLLHSQQYLSEQGTLAEQKLLELQQELEVVRSEVGQRDGQLKAVRRENRKRRKVIEDYQLMMSAGATGLHPCPVCQREFVSAEYLQSHILRRHPGHLVAPPPAHPPDTKEEEPDGAAGLEGRLLELMTERLQQTERQLRQEIASKEEEGRVEQARQLEEWKQQEQLKMEREMQAFKEPLLGELREGREERAHLEQELSKKQDELDSVRRKRHSHLGTLEGAQELDLRGAEKLAKKSAAEAAKTKQQFESKVEELQSALKQQDRAWQRRMEKLASTHHEQLRESSERLGSLEHSLRGVAAEGDSGQLQQQLTRLKKKVSQQEHQLLTQQQQLTVLHSREPSPVHSVTTPPIATPTQQQDELSDSDDELTDTSEDGASSAEEDVDGGGQRFTPFPHRPSITTRYSHGSEVLEGIKRETRAILSDALLQRGLLKGAAGLSCSQFEQKMKGLEQERKQRMKMHYNFSEHRERLARAVDSTAAANCVFDPRHHLPQRTGKHRTGKKLNASLPVGGRSSGKPPKPTSAKLSSSQPVAAVAVMDTPQTSPVRSAAAAVVVLGGKDSGRPALRITATARSDSDGLSDSEEEEEEEDTPDTGLTPSPPPAARPHPLTADTGLAPPPTHPPANTAAVVAVHRPAALVRAVVPQQEEQEDSPWDSDGDSIEQLAAPQGRASSTPIKLQVAALRNSVELVPRPSLRPVGGVPIFPQPAPPPTTITQQSDSDDSFDVTDPSVPPPLAKQSLGSDALNSNNNKPFSRTTTSRSALTTVSFDDFDSDLSDLEITQLT